MSSDQGSLTVYAKRWHQRSKSFPVEWMQYLLEGILHQLNEHREIFTEGSMWIGHMNHRYGYDFRFEYDPNIKTAKGEEIGIDMLCQYDPDSLASEGGLWEIWIKWNSINADNDLEALSIPANKFKDGAFKFTEKNLYTFWMP